MESGDSLKNLQCNRNKHQKKNKNPKRNVSHPHIPLVDATLSPSPGWGQCPGLTATSPAVPQGSCPGGAAIRASCELSQPAAMIQLVKSPWSFLFTKKKKGIPTHSWGQRRRRQHNCLSSGESHCAYFHLSVTYDGTALQVEIGPLLLG